MRGSTLLIILLAGAPWLSVAQSSEASWDNLKQLRVGQKIEVVDMKLKSLQGDFTGYSDQEVRLRLGSDEVSVPRAQVLSVKDRERSHRRRNTLLGLAIGAAGGLAVGAIRGATYHEEGETPVFVLVWTPIGAGIGAGVGAALPAGGRVTVYRASARTP